MWPRFGRRDRDGIPAEAIEPMVVDPRDLERAYERGLAEGRREERRRHSHPIRNLMIGVVVLAGGVVLGVAAWYGSFGEGGRVVDQKLAVAADRAEPALRAAADDAGAALSGAGRDLQTNTDPSTAAEPAPSDQDL
ncbi:hypothetical protein [Phenylobacterium sp.]|uniref:hypothetical protein n=1 Tax=Phenylobacterium sp. TaxID=1871053 RepID=UPI002731EA39|nr:hypothetical protein [Phenylobacterium sp.]MDP1617085.1 hypothetical protein [Phenylobacterium sp.]MDP1988683.1 hypothetical protein [Phenylobacterium sp.]